MARNTYRERLEDLRGEVAAMADVTLDRFEEAVGVLESGEEGRAAFVIEGDADLNDWYLDIENECIELVALQQPVASDLRLIASSFKIVTDLERIGDLAANLAAYGRDAEGELFAAVDVTPIAAAAGGMVRDAMDAYAHNDADTARAVAARDDDIDERCRDASERIVRELIVAHNTTDDVESTLEDVSRALLTVRDLERVGDHAVNICARTLYMVEHDDALIY